MLEQIEKHCQLHISSQRPKIGKMVSKNMFTDYFVWNSFFKSILIVKTKFPKMYGYHFVGDAFDLLSIICVFHFSRYDYKIALKQLNRVLRVKCIFGVIIIGAIYSIKMIIRTPFLSMQLDILTAILVICKCFAIFTSLSY